MKCIYIHVTLGVVQSVYIRECIFPYTCVLWVFKGTVSYRRYFVHQSIGSDDHLEVNQIVLCLY